MIQADTVVRLHFIDDDIKPQKVEVLHPMPYNYEQPGRKPVVLTIMLPSLSRAIRALQLLELMIIFIFTLITRLLKAAVAKLQPLQQHCRIIRYVSLSINLASGLSFPIYYSFLPCHGS